MRWFRTAIAALLVWIGSVSGALAQNPLLLSTGMAEPWTNAQGTGFHQLMVAALFKTLGVPVEVEFNPASARALHLANDGFTDGVVGRVAGLEQANTNLIPISEPFFYNDFVAAASKPQRSSLGWGDLSHFALAYINGWQIFDKNVPPEAEAVRVKDSQQLLMLLSEKRVDLVLHERWQILWLARQSHIKISIAEPALARVPMYIYLHKRHAALVPMAERALRQIKADGTYERIGARVFAGLGASISEVK